jgi:hypothetical protein
VTHVLLLPGERVRAGVDRAKLREGEGSGGVSGYSHWCGSQGAGFGRSLRPREHHGPARRLCCNTGRRFLMSRDPSDRTWFQLAECAGELLRRPRVQTLSRGCLGWREEPFSSHLIRLHWSKPPPSKSPHP